MKPIIAHYENLKIGDKIPVYGAKKIKIGCSGGSGMVFNSTIYISNTLFETMGSIEFPIINGKSPEYLTITYLGKEGLVLRVLIEEFGGTPSPTYFEDGA